MAIRAITWRTAIQASDLSSSTKLVLYNLSIHMNEHGESCYPSIERQSADTGFSKRAVIEHIQKAEAAGFILKKTHGFSGQKWKSHEYVAVLPRTVLDKVLVDIQEEKGGDSASPPFVPENIVENQQRRLPSFQKVVTQGNPNLTKEHKEINKRNIKRKKSEMLTLEKWEEMIGTQLCIGQMANWVKDNRLDPDKIKILIPRFREKMVSQGKLYANFVATFQVWLREGWLGMSFTAAQLPTAVVTKVAIVERGLTL